MKIAFGTFRSLTAAERKKYPAYRYVIQTPYLCEYQDQTIKIPVGFLTNGPCYYGYSYIFKEWLRYIDHPDTKEIMAAILKIENLSWYCIFHNGLQLYLEKEQCDYHFLGEEDYFRNEDAIRKYFVGKNEQSSMYLYHLYAHNYDFKETTICIMCYGEENHILTQLRDSGLMYSKKHFDDLPYFDILIRIYDRKQISLLERLSYQEWFRNIYEVEL